GHPKQIDSINLGRIFLHYYPACPIPELATSQHPHFDPFTFTVLLQDQIGGFLFFHDDHWINFPPLSGAYAINVRNFMEIINSLLLRIMFLSSNLLCHRFK
ncbi:1-aminocyclopropane-1-carboxylate oxidase homolog 10, partial [Linum perenne]